MHLMRARTASVLGTHHSRRLSCKSFLKDPHILLSGAKHDRRSPSGHSMAPLTRQQRQWVEQNLSLREREALIQKQAEPPNTGMTGNGYTFNNTRPGTYACALGGLPVFHSSAKVEKGFGYASFLAPIDASHISVRQIMVGMPRRELDCPITRFRSMQQPAGIMHAEVIDNRAEAHLGWIHTAEDGNNYFCINAASLYFVPDGVDIPTEAWCFLENPIEENANPIKAAPNAAVGRVQHPQRQVHRFELQMHLL